MAVYLAEHPPASRQFYDPRRGKTKASGSIVVHTAESATDLTLPDTGAEGVARFISTRTNPGSYHTIVDADSIVRVGEYGWEMFGEGTGGNRWALHLSFACRAGQWPTLPESWWEPALRNGARAAADMIRWCAATVGVVVPVDTITPAQYRKRLPGFIGHGDLDPDRRSDPGLHFPWERFLNYVRQEIDPVAVPAALAPDKTLRGASQFRLDLIDIITAFPPPEADTGNDLDNYGHVLELANALFRDAVRKVRRRETTFADVLDFAEWFYEDPAAAQAYLAANG